MFDPLKRGDTLILVTRPGDGPYLPRSPFAPVSERAVRDPSPVPRHPLSPLGWAHPVSGPSHPLLTVVPVSAIALHRPERPGLSLICSSHPLSPSPHPPSTFLSTPGRLVPRNALPKVVFLPSRSLPLWHPSALVLDLERETKRITTPCAKASPNSCRAPSIVRFRASIRSDDVPSPARTPSRFP